MSDKRWESVKKGKEKREVVISFMNSEYNRLGIPAYVEFENPTQVDMNTAQRRQNNKVTNRLAKATPQKAMGLYCKLHWEQKTLGLIFTFYEDHGVKLKHTGEYKGKKEEFIRLLKENNYYVLSIYVNEEGLIRFGTPMSIETLSKFPHEVISENCITFYMSATLSPSQKKANYFEFTKTDGIIPFKGTIAQQLLDLTK